MQAFVHSSAVREEVEEARLPCGRFESNERLEFLGDTVIGYIVARRLYARYPDADEGELALRKASLVSDVVLAETAARLGFAKLLIVGAGQAQQPAGPGRTMLADSFEAFVAVLTRAAGFEAAATFVEQQHIVPNERLARPLGDPKTALQEWTQKHHRSTPSYADRYEGPAHARTFHARVWVDGEWLAEGSGPSKKDAERSAAVRALELLGAPLELVGGASTPKKRKSSRHSAANTGST
jgi:ribonuclease-3